MQIIQPYAKTLWLPDRQAGIDLLKKVEFAARISHRSEEAITDTSWEKLLSAVVLQHGDWSVVEHASVTVEAYVDRGITHEWVRHRLGAYTQESTRFISYIKKLVPSFVLPKDIPKYKDEYTYEFSDAYNIWWGAINAAEEAYIALAKLGLAPQLARSVFPTCLASKLIVTYNLRNWRHFFLMRTSKEAHPQMREVTWPLLEEFKAKIPLLYDDIVPGSRQVDNLRLAR